MLELNDGRSELWQWDTGRTLDVDADCTQVHFSNNVFGRSIDVDVVGGVAIIPDILLQTDKDLNVWAFSGTAENGYTKISKTFKVNRRNKPADYVFTPVEQTTIDEIAAIAQSVRNDADAGLFDGKPGENGRDGIDGKDGKDGYTPQKGIDYFDGEPGQAGEKGDPFTYADFTPEQLEALRGPQGIPGPAGSVENLTAENIQSALGYTPADSNEVVQVKDDLSAKIDKPNTTPEVGKILKVLSVNEDGTFVCEWGDAPAGGVTDVTVNGNSIVSDGVGLIKLYPKSLGINTSGIFIRNPNSTDINTRASNAAVSCSQIDYAVKAAMCDGKGEAWTSDEQAAARERIGIPGNYELIHDETINEDIYQYTIDNISLKKAIILFYSVSYTSDNYLLVGLTLDAAVNGNCATVRAITKNGYVSYYYAYCEEGVFHNLTAGPSKPNGATTNSLNKYTEFLFAETITAIKLTAYKSSEVIPAGCRIKVYGVIA